MTTRRFAAAATGALLAGLVVTACTAQPQPVETRLPPGYGASASPPAASVPSPSVVTTSPAPGVETTPAPGVTAAPAPSSPTDDAGALTCADGESRSISGAEQTVRLSGTCGEVTVSGSALTVDASGATIGTLRISGDRARVTAKGIDTLVVQGNDGSVASAGAIGRVDLSGDRSTVEAVGSIDTVTVRGQDNVVRAAGGVGSSTVEGRGNQVG